MGRWEPDAPARLQRAAFELYTERGYHQTTVTEIAARAGLSQRSFFRHFADKREVLFHGSDRFRDTIVGALRPAPTTLEAVTNALAAVGAAFVDRPTVRRRQALLNAYPELQERELSKLVSIAAALASALRRQDVPQPVAELAAETGMTILRVTVARWLDDPAEQSWAVHLNEAMAELRRLTAVAAVPAPNAVERPPSGG